MENGAPELSLERSNLISKAVKGIPGLEGACG